MFEAGIPFYLKTSISLTHPYSQLSPAPYPINQPAHEYGPIRNAKTTASLGPLPRHPTPPSSRRRQQVKISGAFKARPRDPPRPQTKPSSSSAPRSLSPCLATSKIFFFTTPLPCSHITLLAGSQHRALVRAAPSLVLGVNALVSARARVWERQGGGSASGSAAGGGRRPAADGEGAVLRQDQGAQEGALDAGGGQAPRRLHPGQRPRELAPAPQARRSGFQIPQFFAV